MPNEKIKIKFESLIFFTLTHKNGEVIVIRFYGSRNKKKMLKNMCGYTYVRDIFSEHDIAQTIHPILRSFLYFSIYFRYLRLKKKILSSRGFVVPLSITYNLVF